MAQLSAEAILLSALLNNQDVTAAKSYGISPVHFVGYRDHYNWLLNYYESYGTEPSKDMFRSAWPDFRFSDHEDIRSAVDAVFKAFAKQQINSAMAEAIDLLAVGDVQAAYKTLVRAEPRTTAPKPKRLLTDTSFLDHWEESQRYVEVPYGTLQKHTGGIRPGNIWYLAARPGQGKTAHLCNLAMHAVMQGANVKFYSLEMSEMEVRFRFHAALSHYFGEQAPFTLTDLRDRRVSLDAYKTFVSELDDKLQNRGAGVFDIHTPRDGVVSPSIVASQSAEYDLNIVDYIGLMRADDGTAAVTDWRVAAQISNSLKEIALANSTAVLCAAQINRDGETGDAPPKVKNLAQSDALGQDGDVVLTMRAKPHNVATHFSIEKNRHGPSSITFHTTFDPDRGVYVEISGEMVEDMICTVEAER